MELVLKYGRLSFIPFLKYSIPFHSGIFHISYRNFRSNPFHFPFHFIPSPGPMRKSLRKKIIIIIIIKLFIYQVTSYHKKKTATSSRSITKASKYAIPLKPNTQTCRVKAIFSHLVRRQRRTERSSKSTATSPS